jgi:hypothetical protein
LGANNKGKKIMAHSFLAKWVENKNEKGTGVSADP